ncbi:MAG: aminotransferase class I/II-fold pyridoxal phosphate-dependent enzyme [Planctomycetota bacterium]
MKQSVDDLALFGGPIEFAHPLHVGRPNIGNRQRLMERMEELLDRRWLSNDGPLVQEFESLIAERLEVQHCVAMGNGTVALEIAIRAAGMSGEVLVPSFTFIATVHALQWQGIVPVFCDIDPDTHTLDVSRLESRINSRTSGIIGVHLWGRACDVSGIEAIAKQFNLPVIFDAAHAFGCSTGGRMIGGFGRAEVLSFHATKFINSFEGGAIVTNDGQMAQRARQMRNFGFAGYDNVTELGTNGKLNEACAAMGLTSLESFDEFVTVNRRNYVEYARRLRGIAGLNVIVYDERELNNYQYVVLEVGEDLPLSRDDLIQLLFAENVLARKYFYPGCHRMEPYKTLYPDVGVILPQTEAVCRRVLSLPTGTATTLVDIERICQLLSFILQNGETIRLRMGDLAAN